MIRKRSLGLHAAIAFGLVLMGIALFAYLLACEHMLLPPALEPAGRLLYRLLYIATLPVQLIALIAFPPANHHVSLAYKALAYTGTPLIYWGIAQALLAFKRGFHRRRAARAHTTAPAPTRVRIPRSEFIGWGTTATMAAAFGGCTAHSSLIAPGRLCIRRYQIPIRELPPAFDGLRIAHVSDTHYGHFIAMSYLRTVMATVNELKPDLVFLTGDYVHRTLRAIEPGIGVFGLLKARYGVFAVLGNHEFWEDAPACRRTFKATGIPLLDNRRVFLTANGIRPEAKGKPALCIAGIGDLREDEVSFPKALANVPKNVPRLILSHNPDVAELVPPGYRIDLMLSGHTHGGQALLPILGAPHAPSRHGAKYLGGLCQGPHCQVLVSRGVGLAGIPVRIRVPPEVGLITLTPA